MFVLCPHCQFLVATDPVSGQPPSLCPRCAEPMQADNASAALPPVDDADTAADAAMDANGLEPAKSLGEPLVEPLAQPAITPTAALSVSSPPAAPPQDGAGAQDAITTEYAQGDDGTGPRWHASDVPASAEPTPGESERVEQVVDEPAVDEPAVDEHAVDEHAVDEHAVDAQAGDAVATGATDTLSKTMPGPASIEIQAAMDDPSSKPGYPDAPATDLSVTLPAEGAPELVAAEEPEASALSTPPATDPAPETLPGPVEPADTAPALPPPVQRPAKPAPSFVRRPAAVSGVTARRHRLKAAAISGLALVLVLQLVLADRARLAADARWRPAMSTLCNVLHCTLSPWREPAAFTLLQRDVRPHPTIPGALRITATFRNDARWAQPLPGLLLTLSDSDGRAVAARTFTPVEYLGAAGRIASAQTQTPLASGHSKTIAMDVLEPTPRIVAFTFDFQ